MWIEFLLCMLVLFFVIGDVYKHNQAVDREWPGDDQRQRDMARRFRVPLAGHIFLMLMLAVLLIKHIIR